MSPPQEYELRTVDKIWNRYWEELSDAEKRIVNDKLTSTVKFKPYESESLGAD